MPDITMCENEKCPLKEECFRYTAKPSEYRQSYADFEPIVEDGKVSCDWFSVSGVVDNFYENFDAEAKSLSMCDGNLTEQRMLLDKWAESGRVSADMGSRIHYELEIYINELYKRDKTVRKPLFECTTNEIRRSDIMIESGKKFIDTMHKRKQIDTTKIDK